MNERTIKEVLDFLSIGYGLKYTFSKFENYLGTNLSIDTYSYHNENGCFTITNFAVRGEIEYLRLDNVYSLKDYLFSKYSGNNNLDNEELRRYYDEKLNHKIRIFDYEPAIWKKHRLKLFFGRHKTELQALAEVIQAQIDKHGEFFGIKVAKNN